MNFKGNLILYNSPTHQRIESQMKVKYLRRHIHVYFHFSFLLFITKVRENYHKHCIYMAEAAFQLLTYVLRARVISLEQLTLAEFSGE